MEFPQLSVKFARRLRGEADTGCCRRRHSHNLPGSYAEKHLTQTEKAIEQQAVPHGQEKKGEAVMLTKQVIFKLGDEEYGMDISLVTTIENYSGVVPMPNAPAFIIGILSLRGDVIPVYSLRKKFGMPEAAVNEKTQLLITRCNDILVGYKVDSVSEILEFPDSEIKKIPEIVRCADTRYALGVANRKERLIVLLDIVNILNEQEAAAVKDFAEQHEKKEE